MPQILYTTWHGAYVVQDGRVVKSAPFPDDPAGLAERLSQRREGLLASEERELLGSLSGNDVVTSDRRLAGGAVQWSPARRLPPSPEAIRTSLGDFRSVLLRSAAEALESAWDPSIHLEEAVRAMSDLDQMQNALGERLASWGGRDSTRSEPDAPEAVRPLIDRILRDEAGEGLAIAAPAPELAAARRELARLYQATAQTHAGLEQAIEKLVPLATPNLSALLGPLLTARLLSQAGGLARLARLPSSTIQVLGAERAFFEHLRGRAPPPRHGLLFLHPDIQSAPRKMRGKLARAMAGKVAIAARLDQAGTPTDPSLLTAYRARSTELRARSARTRAATGDH
jgi:nucleolar protein 56